MCFTTEDADLVVDKIDHILTGSAPHHHLHVWGVRWLHTLRKVCNYLFLLMMCFCLSSVRTWEGLGVKAQRRTACEEWWHREEGQCDSSYSQRRINLSVNCVGFSFISLWFNFKLPAENGHQLHSRLVNSNGSGAGVLWQTHQNITVPRSKLENNLLLITHQQLGGGGWGGEWSSRGKENAIIVSHWDFSI